LFAAGFWMTPFLCTAAPSTPSTITRFPSNTDNHVTVAWSTVTGATSYKVKRGASPTSALATLATVTTTTFTDTTALPGVRYYYTVTASDADSVSPPTRGLLAAASVIVDNDGVGTSFTGTWSGSSVTGYYGTAPVFPSPTAGATPTATHTFTPNLPARVNHDVYMRWTTCANSATNTPVGFVFPDGSSSVTVNQQLYNGVWMLLSNITAEAGDAANPADPDSDGLDNLLEFATGRSPVTPDGSITALTKSAGVLEFTYRKSHSAVADGFQFAVEWSNVLSAGWSVADVTQSLVPNTDDGVSTLCKATLPSGTNRRFVRLKVRSSGP
jgi:hypothetical protein